jgi:hypothetical protein
MPNGGYASAPERRAVTFRQSGRFPEPKPQFYRVLPRANGIRGVLDGRELIGRAVITETPSCADNAVEKQRLPANRGDRGEFRVAAGDVAAEA